MQVQPHGVGGPRRGRPSHARHRTQQRAIHRGQGRQSLADPRVAPLTPAQGLLSEAAHHLIQHLRTEEMLRFGKRGRGKGRRADLAHLAATTGMAEGAQTLDHRIEHGKKEGAKIILGKEGAELVRLRRSARTGRQERQHFPAKAIQQLPVVQLLFGNRGALGHCQEQTRSTAKVQVTIR